MIDAAFNPINNIFRSDLCKNKSLSGLGAEFPCVPFYQFNTKPIAVFYQTSIAVPIFNVVWNLAQSISGYGAIINIITILEGLLNKGRKEAQYEQYIINHYESANKALQWKIDCHLPYCEIAQSLTDIDIQGTFYRPDLQEDLMRKFIVLTVAINNARLKSNSHIQPILSCYPVDENQSGGFENLFPLGAMMIRVPNIEAYWLGEKIKIIGTSLEPTIMMRHGYTEGKKFTASALHNLRDHRYLCDGMYEKDNPNSYMYNLGWNLENLKGEGVMVLNIPYANNGTKIKSTTKIQLLNTEIIKVPGEEQPKPPSGDGTPPPSENPLLEPKKPTTIASIMQPLSIVLLLGVAAGFLYEAYKNK
jgi:hypothetical protein